VAYQVGDRVLDVAGKQALLGTDDLGGRLQGVLAAVRMRTITDSELATSWFEQVRKTAERLMGEARLLGDALRSPDARKGLSQLQAVAESLQRVAAAELARRR
jgi:hypothetical protein